MDRIDRRGGEQNFRIKKKKGKFVSLEKESGTSLTLHRDSSLSENCHK
jgi:hypothetical protein